MAQVTPRCMFAIFADEFRLRDGGFDLLNIHNQVTVIPAESGAAGVKRHLTTLFVMVFAGEGRHTLTFYHEGYEYLKPVSFEILPEHLNVFTQAVTQEFPVAFFDEPTVNAYPILLDGVPFTTAFLVSNSL